jgi:hypothetical protein
MREPPSKRPQRDCPKRSRSNVRLGSCFKNNLSTTRRVDVLSASRSTEASARAYLRFELLVDHRQDETFEPAQRASKTPLSPTPRWTSRCGLLTAATAARTGIAPDTCDSRLFAPVPYCAGPRADGIRGAAGSHRQVHVQPRCRAAGDIDSSEAGQAPRSASG